MRPGKKPETALRAGPLPPQPRRQPQRPCSRGPGQGRRRRRRGGCRAPSHRRRCPSACGEQSRAGRFLHPSPQLLPSTGSPALPSAFHLAWAAKGRAAGAASESHAARWDEPATHLGSVRERPSASATGVAVPTIVALNASPSALHPPGGGTAARTALTGSQQAWPARAASCPWGHAPCPALLGPGHTMAVEPGPDSAELLSSSLGAECRS